jgi:acyl dehydratase
MPVDRDVALQLELPARTVTVERGALRAFAAATGSTDPRYTDVEHARAAGLPDLPVPPTYFFSLELLAGEPFEFLELLGVDLARVLHGAQEFDFHAPAYAGDELTIQPRITDVASKKGGRLELVTKETAFRRDDELVATLRAVLVVRHPEVAA